MSLLGTVFVLDDKVKNNKCNNLNYPNVTEINDVVYSDKNPDVCKLDILFDEAKSGALVPGKYPVLFNIHGGGWIVGDKKYRRGFAIQFADAGMLVVNINYGLAPKYTYPYGIQNVFDALKWVEENASAYNLDLDNVFIAGDSAGGHMSAVTLAALDNDYLKEKMGLTATSIRFKGALLFCGVYNFDKPLLRIPVANSMLRDMTGMKASKYKEFPYYDCLNPIPYVTDMWPKTMFISGAQDFFTAGQPEELAARFDEVGVPYARYHAKQFFNCFHCFHLKVYMREAKNCIASAKQFIFDNIS